MRWQGREESENVEDRRKAPVAGLAAGGGIVTIILAIIVMILGGDPQKLLDQGNMQQVAGGLSDEELEAQAPLVSFVKVVLKDTEDVWEKLTPDLRKVSGRSNLVYVKPKLNLFSGQTQSACGNADASVGPFYCPGDQEVYLDLAFFRELQDRFKAPGDFAMAYVVAHEVGHHLQQLLGLSAKVQRMQASAPNEVASRQLSVRLELQADYLAGVWAHHAQKMKDILEKGDLEEALNAASRIGDDSIQKQMTGRVRPDAFTHGSAKQRVYWLKKGMQTGDLSKVMAPFEVEYEDL